MTCLNMFGYLDLPTHHDVFFLPISDHKPFWQYFFVSSKAIWNTYSIPWPAIFRGTPGNLGKFHDFSKHIFDHQQ